MTSIIFLNRRAIIAIQNKWEEKMKEWKGRKEEQGLKKETWSQSVRRKHHRKKGEKHI